MHGKWEKRSRNFWRAQPVKGRDTDMLKKLLPKNIRGKILVCTAAATVLIAAATLSICYCIFQSFLRTSQLSSAEYNLQLVSHSVSGAMGNITGFGDWCRSNTTIGEFLDDFEGQAQMPSIYSTKSRLRSVALNAYERFKEEYYNTHSSDYITRAVISPDNCRNYLQISDSVSTVTASYLSGQDFFETLYQAPDYRWDGFAREGDSLILPIVRPIYHPYDARPCGWLYLSVSSRLISDPLDAFPLAGDSSLFLTIGDRSYEYAQGVFTETALDFPVIRPIHEKGLSPDSAASLVRLPDGSARSMLTLPMGVEGWSLSLILSQQDLSAQNAAYLLIIGGIALIILFLGLGLGFLLNRIITRPVQQLKEKITAVAGGDFSPEPSIEWEDEFGEIGQGINRMSKDLKALMDSRVESEKQKKDLEYQILQSQINPHFLYNTLNSIKWMATIQNATGIAEMTTALARLMKNVSKGTGAMIPLGEELGLVKDYFLIQKYRYGGSISLSVSIEEPSLEQALIHRFTLQPIVENALFHGIEPKGCAGTISIQACRQSLEGRDALVISVTDNGIGMDEATIRQVLSGGTASSADFFKKLGISNVAQRIRYSFGPPYGLAIKSRPGEYTAMTITLPYMTKEDLRDD